MLPLATHCHTHYHLHPFDFVLIKFKVLVAKQRPTHTHTHAHTHTHIPHTHTHTPHTHSYTHTTHTHTHIPHSHTHTHSFTTMLLTIISRHTQLARHQVNFVLEHFQCSFNVDVDVWDIPTTVFIFVINLLFIHNLGDFCFCFSVI